MKKWTVVIELSTIALLSQSDVYNYISRILSGQLTTPDSFRIMETINAPYGPEGVFIDERQRPKP